MLLHLKRSERDARIGNKPVFILDARVTLTNNEAAMISRHQLGEKLVYTSEAAANHAAASFGNRSPFAMDKNWLNKPGDIGQSTVGAMQAGAGNLLGGMANFGYNALMNAGHLALAKMNLKIRVVDLTKGVHIEMKSLEEVVAVENAIAEACQNVLGYLSVVSMFDGKEQTIRFDENGVVAPDVLEAPRLPLSEPAQSADPPKRNVDPVLGF